MYDDTPGTTPTVGVSSLLRELGELYGMTTRGDAPPNAAQSAALASLLQTAGPVLARTAGVLGDVDRVNQKLRGTGVQLNPSVPPVRDGKLADQDEE